LKNVCERKQLPGCGECECVAGCGLVKNYFLIEIRYTTPPQLLEAKILAKLENLRRNYQVKSFSN
jgi:hypothetical protein